LVHADAQLLKQVWVNLIANAIKFSSKADVPEIEIGFEESGHETTFYIKDNGVGFDMRFSNKLFKVFQRLHSVEEFPGTGVGLAIVKRIITSHEGRIWAESEEGKGSTFFFTIPKMIRHAA
jgi:light-regulated signal transduction histidine kinase (bacteriophytochrome)